jgi:hypothetical protein
MTRDSRSRRLLSGIVRRVETATRRARVRLAASRRAKHSRHGLFAHAALQSSISGRFLKMTKYAQHSRHSSRLILLSAVAAIAVLVGGTAYACPLGSHDSPRVRLLHGLQHKGQHASGHGMKLAQLQSQTPS